MTSLGKRSRVPTEKARDAQQDQTPSKKSKKATVGDLIAQQSADSAVAAVVVSSLQQQSLPSAPLKKSRDSDSSAVAAPANAPANAAPPLGKFATSAPVDASVRCLMFVAVQNINKRIHVYIFTCMYIGITHMYSAENVDLQKNPYFVHLVYILTHMYIFGLRNHLYFHISPLSYVCY